ncbi:surfeit locus protein 1-like isoform X2 [Tasmannia lanceolata]|uniref:surfeit locus protein 1-like isoform X2 n=1 Tax=Tasmannia lanceolata TaxID=3420 RepID=UPI004062AD18
MAASLSKTLKPHIFFLLIPNKRTPLQTPLFSPLTSFERTLSSSSSSLPSQSQEKQSGRWSRWLLFIPGAITFGLGTWQIFRRQEKIEMVDYRKKRLELEPILLNSTFSSNGDLGSLEFRRVICEGVFNESKSIYIGPRSRSISGVTENGYYVVTPLMPIANKSDSVQLPILVNRGWVPRSWRNKSLGDLQDGEKPSDIPSPDVGENEGSSWWRFWSKKPKDQEPSITPVKVIGVVRGSEKPSIFVPANDPSSGQWFFVDVPEIARATGLAENTIYIEDINDNVSASQPYPVPKDVTTLIRHSVMPQDHLNYTLTWYSLSAAVTFMAVKRLMPKKSRR